MRHAAAPTAPGCTPRNALDFAPASASGDNHPLPASVPISLDQARAAILDRCAPLPAESVPLADALGRHLAAEVVATAPLQGFDNSAMDGYAVRAADTSSAGPEAPVLLRVGGESRAGRPANLELGPGEACAISTGAMLPAGADAVVRIEDTRREDERVAVLAVAGSGDYVRRAGEDVTPGTAVLRRGERLGAAELAILAALGEESARCARQPRVSVLTCGDELIGPGRPLAPGQVHDSNSVAVTAMVAAAGAKPLSIATVGDDPGATRKAIAAGLEADVLVVCGGVSVGAHDHVRGALATLGVEQAFWRIGLKPGGPAWFGTRGASLVFGLPGNPVSVLVTFTLLVRPALAALEGAPTGRPRTTATLASAHEKSHRRAEAVRCRLELTPQGWLAHPAPHQGSHVLTSMLGADCLALIPAESDGAEAGERVEIELLEAARIVP